MEENKDKTMAAEAADKTTPDAVSSNHKAESSNLKAESSNHKAESSNQKAEASKPKEGNAESNGVKPEVLSVEEIMQMVPKLQGHPKLVKWLMKLIALDKVNKLHSDNYKTPGVPFTDGLLRDLNIKVEVEGREVLDNLPEGAFITVSNHPFGALDGIILINLIGHRRPQFRVIVNMILNHISAMRENFIAVDQSASTDPEKQKVSKRGIMQAVKQVRDGQPLGMFPAGAMSKIDCHGQLVDREWQETMIRLIEKLKVPVVPIFFQGRNSFMFDFLGVTCWQLRTARLPSEVFRKANTTIRVSVGQPITVKEQLAHSGSIDELRDFIRQRTYSLSDFNKKR